MYENTGCDDKMTAENSGICYNCTQISQRIGELEGQIALKDTLGTDHLRKYTVNRLCKFSPALEDLAASESRPRRAA